MDILDALKAITMLGISLTSSIGVAHADDYDDTIALFKNAGQSAKYFSKSYGYAVFPTIGQGGLMVGGYQKAMAVIAIAKGGLMYVASVGGEKFFYKAIGAP
jgi:hypothetical protein